MKLHTIRIRICEARLNGEGQECHTPGCAMWLHAVDLPFYPLIYEVIETDVVE